MRGLPELRELCIIQLLFTVCSTKAASDQEWSSEVLSQTSRLHCLPQVQKLNTTFLHGTKSGNFTKLGKVKDMAVCVLLCCEIDSCDAAFMAQNSCFAVKCYSRNHCVTAPARHNKWLPMVAFVKRPENELQRKEKAKSLHEETTVKAKTTPQAEDTSSSLPEHAQFLGNTAPSSPQTIPEPSEGVQQHRGKDESHLTNSFQFEENPPQKTNKDEFIIQVEPKKQSVEFEEMQKYSRTHPKAKHQTKGFHNSQYTLLSAAVVTCLMAFMLSGFAVLAAKIRKNSDEQAEDYLETGNYRPLSTNEN